MYSAAALERLKNTAKPQKTTNAATPTVNDQYEESLALAIKLSLNQT